MNFLFPFSGIIGQENAKKALLCSLVHEEIRSVLIIGDSGTAKSSLVRSVGTIKDDKPILTIPQAVTYDRLMGMIDLEKAVTSGSIQVTPGLLEEGDGQILYADNINLMEEGIVNSILNTSETGHFILEREGLSHNVTTRFTFFATMDPAEGELSPGQMDRFDLCVRLDRIDESELRAEIVKNQLKFETEVESFLLKHQDETDSLKKKVTAAEDRLPYVSIPEALQDLVSSLCLELAVEGQRGDLAVARTARALAALDKRDEVNFEDIKEAALLALEHRRKEKSGCPPPEPPEEKNEKEDKQEENRQDPQTREPPQKEDSQPQEEEQKEQDHGITPPPPISEKIFDIGATFEVIRYLDEQSWQATRKQKSGRRTRVQSTDSSGHYHTFRLPAKNRNDIAIDATLRAAAPYQRHRKGKGLAISVLKGDIREKVREKKVAHTILFLVDASGSMGVQKRMIAVKGAILSLLHDAYLKRDRVGLMIFRGKDAHLLLPPTKSPDHAAKMLKTIPTGGMTPLGKGLIESHNILTRGRFASADENRSIVILTDGRGNVPINGKSPSEELKEITEKIAFTGIRFVVVDTETGFPRLGRAQVLAGNLNALYFRLEDLGIHGLAGSVHNTIYSSK